MTFVQPPLNFLGAFLVPGNGRLSGPVSIALVVFDMLDMCLAVEELVFTCIGMTDGSTIESIEDTEFVLVLGVDSRIYSLISEMFE